MTRSPKYVAHVAGSSSSLTDFVSEQLHQRVVVAVHLGAPRANRKPVLELIDEAGRAVAFGKLGVNALTDRLVEAETDALTAIAERSLPHVTHPRVIARACWQGHPLLLQTALPAERAESAPARLVAAAAREIAAVPDASPSPLADSPYVADLGRRIASLPSGEAPDVLREALLGLEDSAGHHCLGAWHGDWTAWNMAAVAGTLMVWDWERYDSPVPAGFDLLHYAFQSAVQKDPRHAPKHAGDLMERAPQLLPWMDAATARATTRLYVIEIAVRYLADGQAAAGGRLGDVLPWVTPVLTETEEKSISRSTDQPGHQP